MFGAGESRIRIPIAVIGLWLALSATAQGQRVVPAVITDAGVARVRSEVTVRVDGATRVARFEVQEEFVNHGGRLGEADYLYPIPAGAVFTDLSLYAGETELRGEMLPADRARSIYEEIVRRQRDPALVELLGSAVIRARVFPIGPGETRKIVLRYTQVLATEADVVRLRYPRSAGLIAPVVASEQPEPRHRHGGPGPAGPGGGFALRILIEAADRYVQPISPTHPIAVSDRGGEVIEVRFDAGAPLRSDFELLLPLRRSGVGLGLLTHSPAPGREDGAFMLMLMPPQVRAERTLPRDVTLVLDVSGSMSGHKIDQARGALRQILRGLRRVDRFRVIVFASAVRSFAEEFRGAEPAEVAAAIDWLEGVPADGSTNLYEALSAALEPATSPERLSLVVFLTDGLPTVSETDPEVIADLADRRRDGERVFAFGVGEDVNTYLLDRLARGGRGAVSYVLPSEDVEGAVSALTRKIGAPVLTDLRIVDAPVVLEDAYPRPLPDLFAGEELVLLGRYRGAGAGPLVIEGRRGDATERLEFEVAFPARRDEDAFITRLWAARKAGALTAEIRINGPDPELIEEIRQLGLKYGVLTEYTSYLVQEPGMALEMDADRLVRQVTAAAPAPAAQTGREAFRRARASSEASGAATVAEAEEALLDAAAPAAGEGASAWQRAGRRLFVEREGVWQDVRAEDAPTSIAIEPYGEAWFELLERLPGLRACAALGDRVVIAGEGLVLRFEPGGRTRLDAGQIARIVEAFGADR